MDKSFLEKLQLDLNELKIGGLYKEEREINSPQAGEIRLANEKKVLNFCSNNYLGLADNQEIIEAAKASFEPFGFGLSSVRFICGTQTCHRQLEKQISQFLQTEDTILYSSCFDANGGLFETLLGEQDAIISDSLNHASIIDGVRLSKAKRFRYQNNDMNDLEAKLKEAASCRTKIIATDGVFSMDGIIANLKAVCDLADRYNALVMVDDAHATGFLGKKGRGSVEYCGVLGRVDILTGTFGKALGGASGGYTSGRKEIINWLRQRSRPYLFSNTLAPCLVAGAAKALEIADKGDHLRETLQHNSHYFRQKMNKLGFNLVPGEHPIIPVMLGDALLAQQFAEKMLNHGIYVVGFAYPVVPQGKARIRTQMSAAHTVPMLDKACQAFEAVGKELGVIK